MEVSCQLHAPATLTPGTEPPVTDSIGGYMGPRAGLEVRGMRKCSLNLPGIEPRFLGRLTRSLVAIPTKLSRLLPLPMRCPNSSKISSALEARIPIYTYIHTHTQYILIQISITILMEWLDKIKRTWCYISYIKFLRASPFTGKYEYNSEFIRIIRKTIF
jgi:hypothetical protein